MRIGAAATVPSACRQLTCFTTSELVCQAGFLQPTPSETLASWPGANPATAAMILNYQLDISAGTIVCQPLLSSSHPTSFTGCGDGRFRAPFAQCVVVDVRSLVQFLTRHSGFFLLLSSSPHLEWKQSHVSQLWLGQDVRFQKRQACLKEYRFCSEIWQIWGENCILSQTPVQAA